MTGTGNTSHNAEIHNGQYTPNIGTTTLKVFCNDNEGFAIYANGYTNQEDGNNLLINSAINNNNTIATGTATSGDTSNWAMMLTKKADSGDTTGENALTIDSAPNTEGGDPASFASYHTVPTEFTKVAHKNASTNMDTATGGATLETTYAAYINQTQSAGTYSGKVKYVLVHPSTAMAPVGAGKIGVQYNANGSSFTGGVTKNEVVYASNCSTVTADYKLSKSSNVNADGTQDTSASIQFEYDTIQIPGASQLKVVIKYGMAEKTGNVWVMEGPFPEAGPPEHSYTLSGTGEETYTIDGDEVTFVVNEFGNTPASPNYGYYTKVYPLDASGNEYTFEETNCSLDVDSGSYATTNSNWYGSWYADINNTHYEFFDESEVLNYLTNNVSNLSGTTINLYRSLSFNEAYARAGKTQTSGYYSQQDLNHGMCNTIAVGQNQTIRDTRDGNAYMAGKLKDGNCWMLDNLALDPTDATTAANMNENNTNATSAAITNLLNGGSTTTGWSNIAVVDEDNSFYSCTAPMINNASKDTLVTSYGPAATNGQAKVGLYYNYCAASASTYCYESDQGVDVPDTDKDASQDICPANWRMPTLENYAAIVNRYSTNASDSDSLQYNLSTPLSGYYNISSAYNQGYWGYWWSSTYGDSYNMYILYVNPTYVYPNYSNYRDYGYTMRCLVGE